MDRIDDRYRLRAIDFAKNINDKLADYILENKDELHLQAGLYDALEAAGLEPRNPCHWELISESLESRLNQDIVLKKDSREISPYISLNDEIELKRIYRNSCKKVKEELIEIFKEYIKDGKEFSINGEILHPNPGVNIYFKQGVLRIVPINCIVPTIVLMKTFWNKYKLYAYDHMRQDFDVYLNESFETGFYSQCPSAVSNFYESFIQFCGLPQMIKSTKKISEENSARVALKKKAEDEQNRIKAEQARKEILSKALR